jgi:flagellar hook-associated protein 2
MPQIAQTGFSGSQSRLDIGSIVRKLVSIEKQPIDAARRKQTSITAELSSFSTLRVSLSGLVSALTPLKSLSSFHSKSVSSSDTTRVTATATSSAISGVSTINQVVQRAQSHKLQSGPYPSNTEVVGTGTLKIKVGNGQETVINIDRDHQSLSGVRDKVNAANAGVTASVLRINETEYKLLLQANESGEKNQIQVDGVDADGNNDDSQGLSRLLYTPDHFDTDDHLSQTQAAQDAIVEIDGSRFSRSTNTISDAIPGVTLSLLKETENDANIAINVSTSATAVKGQIESFVTAYNLVIKELNAAQSFDRETGQRGPLLGDGVARAITNNLQSLVRGRVPGLKSLHSSVVHIGITSAIDEALKTDGTLKIDSSKLEAALQADPLAVGRVFALVNSTVDPTVSVTTSGIADQIFKSVSALLRPKTGEIALKEKGLKGSIASIENDVLKLGNRVEAFEIRTRDKFAKLEGVLEGIAGVGSGLSSQLSQISNLLGSLRTRSSRRAST